MEQIDIIRNEIHCFSSYRRAFTAREVAEQSEVPLAPDTIQRCLLEEEGFVCMEGGPEGNHTFVPKKTVLQWYVHLILRLARARLGRISESKLLFMVNSMSPFSQWDVVPDEIIDFGRRFGFIGRARAHGEYVVPLAHLLSFMRPYSLAAAAEIVEAVASNVNSRSEGFVQETIAEGLAELPTREGFVLVCRNGLPWERITMRLPSGEGFVRICRRGTGRLLKARLPRDWLVHLEQSGTMLTLREIAHRLGCSRERCRQLEKKASSQRVLRARLLTALVQDLASRGGSVVYEKEDQWPVRKLIARCLGMPYAEFPEKHLFVLGLSRKQFEKLEWPIDAGDVGSLVDWLDSRLKPAVFEEDLQRLVQCVPVARGPKPDALQRILDVMENMAKPAHYSDIADAYNEWFPDDVKSEKNVHSLLHSERGKANGIVWVGVQGTFALRTWGYDRPHKSLHETIRKIVVERYKRTGKPIPREVIFAELGKHRKVVNPNSAQMAMSRNPDLEEISPGNFVPKKYGKCKKGEDSPEMIHRALEKFNRWRLRTADKANSSRRAKPAKRK